MPYTWCVSPVRNPFRLTAVALLLLLLTTSAVPGTRAVSRRGKLHRAEPAASAASRAHRYNDWERGRRGRPSSAGSDASVVTSTVGDGGESGLYPSSSGHRVIGKKRVGGGRGTSPVGVNPHWDESKLVRFLHFHKVGGTTLCKVAQKASLASADSLHVQRNCNFRGDGPTGCGREHRTCAQVMEMHRKHRISYATIECWFDPIADVCPGLVYATMLRDPVARIESHLAYHNAQVKHFLEPLRSKQHHVPRGGDKINFMGSTFAGHNFYVRSLGGRKGFYVPQSDLDETHLFSAMRVLRSVFHVVMILESDEKTTLLRSLPGFEHSSFLVANARGAKRPSISQASRDELRSYNQLDLQLVEYAKLLSTMHYHRALNESAKLEAARVSVDAFEDVIAAKIGREGVPRVHEPEWP